MDDFEKFCQRVRHFRVNASMSQEDLAEASELDRTYISGIERGKRNPTLKNILKIAKALNVHPSDLFR